jgi:hypothetical protein
MSESLLPDVECVAVDVTVAFDMVAFEPNKNKNKYDD